MTRSAAALAGVLTLTLVVALWAVGGGPAGLLYFAVYIVAVLPGLPLGFSLFGRDQPAGWIAGAAIGYAVVIVALWAVVSAHAASAVGFGVALLIAALLTWGFAGRRGKPSVTLPPWTGAATASLAVVLLLTLALAAPPLANVGAMDAQGNKRYRAYFTADFVWHTALTAELTRFALPPRNPYLAPQPMHYYWGYFLVPAAVAQFGPPPLRDVERCLKLNALLSGLLLISTIFVAAWAAVRSPIAAAGATLLALCAASLEGAYALGRILARHAPVAAVRDLNVDALTAWYFQGHRIDGLPRCLWYVPQHSMAYALGLIALTAAAVAGSEASIGGIVLAGLTLGGSTLINPFVGGVFALVWGAAVAADAIRRADGASRIARHAIAAVPVVLAIVWCLLNRMVEGAGGALEIGLRGPSVHAPFVTLMLSLGPVLVAALIGLLVPAPPSRAAVLPAALLAATSLWLMYFVRLDVDHEWVPFRAGQMLLAALAVLAARWFAAPLGKIAHRATLAAAVALFAAGAPTTVIDAYNARDIDNVGSGPGFRWTLVLSPDQQQAFEWIRNTTPREAIVQMEPVVRERDSWSLIPSFAQRHMAAGLPISLLRVPAYRERSEQVKTIFASTDPHVASELAHHLRIQYLYVDATDREAYPAAAKFDAAPQFFEPVFRRGTTAIYQVR